MWWKGEIYRGYAHDCLWHAEQAKSPERRAKLVELAHFWVRVAQAVDADRTTGVTHATPRQAAMSPRIGGAAGCPGIESRQVAQSPFH
jgi:hypothetical protein